METVTWIAQLVQLGISGALWAGTWAVARGTDRSWMIGVQFMLFLSTLIASGILVVGDELDLRDHLRAFAVRPEVLIAQAWIRVRSGAERERTDRSEGQGEQGGK
jgi:hypothetical protein